MSFRAERSKCVSTPVFIMKKVTVKAEATAAKAGSQRGLKLHKLLFVSVTAQVMISVKVAHSRMAMKATMAPAWDR